MAAIRLRDVLVDSPISLGAKARMRRWEMFQDAFPDIETLHLLDLGGTVETWLRAPVRPKHVTVVNLYEPGEPDGDWIVPVIGDACDAAGVLAEAGVNTNFDIVYSNSVIEHVGGHARRYELAEQIRQLGPRHWVQTPYRYFPVEPHWLFPGMQFLPAAAKMKVARHWPLAYSRPDNDLDARRSVLSTELIGLTQMREYFPTSTILHEKVLGITKSLIAMS